MPFRDKNRVLKPRLFKINPDDTRLLIGEDPDSVLILRNLTKYTALLAAGVVIATSIVLKDLPLICINLLLTLAILFYQIYKLAVNKDERLRFLIELIIILGAAGIAAWIAFPMLMSAPITYITALIFSNYIATVINIAAYISRYFSPFIASCLYEHKSESSKFEMTKGTNDGAIRNVLITYLSQKPGFDFKTINLKSEENIQKEIFLKKEINKIIHYLDKKLKKIQSRFLSSEIYAEKIALLKILIHNARKGDLRDLLSEFQQKRISQHSKISLVQEYKEKSNQAFEKFEGDSKLDDLNAFLEQYTTLPRIPTPKEAKVIAERKKSVDAAFEEVEAYYTEKINLFDGFLRNFDMPLEKNPLNILKKQKKPHPACTIRNVAPRPSVTVLHQALGHPPL